MSDVNLGNIFYGIMAKDLTRAGTESAKGNFAATGLAIGAAVTAIGGAGVLMIDQNNKLMKSINDVSLETGIEVGYLRDLTMELSNGNDSISEVTSTMEALGKYHITSADQMKTDTEAALKLADANGTTGEVVANNVVPALQAYGLTVDDISAKSDEFTAITHSTKYALTDVTNLLAKASPAATKAGLGFDDMTLVIEALGLKGVPARMAISDINQAIATSSKTTMDGKVSLTQLSSALKLTTSDMANATSEMKKNIGATEKYDEIAQQHIGLMANIANWWEKTTDNIGAALTPYSSAFTAITALGGAVTVLNEFLMLNNSLQITNKIVTLASTAATEAATAAQWLFDAALNANPLGLLVLGIAGLVGGLILLDSQFHFIQPILQWFGDQLSGIASIAGTVGGLIGSVTGLGGSSGIPAHATGGTMAAGEAGIVGDAGPELWVPNTGGTVVPNGQFGTGGGSAGGDTYTISVTVNGAGKDGQQIGNDIGATLSRYLRNNRISMGKPTSNG